MSPDGAQPPPADDVGRTRVVARDDEPSERDERPGRGRARRTVIRAGVVAGALAVAALVALALGRIGFSRIGDSLTSVDFGWLAVALAIDGLSLVVRGISWHAVLRAAAPDARVGIGRVISATMVGVLGSAVMPGRVGEPARAYLVARRAGNTRRSFPVVLGTVFSQTLINLVALAILAAITLTSVTLFQSHAAAIAIAVAVPVAIGLAIVAAPRLLAIAARARWRRARRVAQLVAGEIVQVRRGLRVFRDLRHGSGATVAQLVAWALQVMACYTVILALHLDPKANVAAAAAILLAVNVTAAVPITPSNLGVFQAACIAVLAAYGIGAGRGLAYGILLQAVEVVTAVVLGVPALLHEGMSWRDIRRVGRAIDD